MKAICKYFPGFLFQIAFVAKNVRCTQQKLT
jgi:hypothetical protein